MTAAKSLSRPCIEPGSSSSGKARPFATYLSSVPRAYTSVAVVYFLSFLSSGASKPLSTAPKMLVPAFSRQRFMPKSPSTKAPESATSTFSGFISPCTMPKSLHASSAEHISRPKRTASSCVGCTLS